MMTTTEPNRLDPVLAGVEHAAADALDSMRLAVGILRGGRQETTRLAGSDGRSSNRR